MVLKEMSPERCKAGHWRAFTKGGGGGLVLLQRVTFQSQKRSR